MPLYLDWIDRSVDSVADALHLITETPPSSSAHKKCVTESSSLGEAPSEIRGSSCSKAIGSEESKNLARSIPKSIPLPKPNLFALIIGIDEYEDKTIPTLTGCLSDAKDMVEYLTSVHAVPPEQIIVRLGKDATRKRIKADMRALIEDKRINQGDPILFFYAGHGAQASAPKNYAAGSYNAKIELLLPYDFVSMTNNVPAQQGISDITLDALLSQLSAEKGNNITVILDCCHAASATRNSGSLITDTQPTESVVRGVQLPDDYEMLPIQNVDIEGRKIAMLADDLKLHARSHVLLAACGKDQVAREANKRGIFTETLLKLLRSGTVDIGAISYREIIDSIVLPMKQTPHCYGVHYDRVLFDGKAPSSYQLLIPIKQTAKGLVQLGRGEVHGITKGAEFSVHTAPDLSTKPIGTLVAGTPDAFVTPVEKTSCNLPSMAWAQQMHAGDRGTVSVAIRSDQAYLDVLIYAAEKIRAGFRGIRWVDLTKGGSYELAIDVDGMSGKAMFDLGDKACVQEGIARLPHQVPLTGEDVHAVLEHAVNFFSHLRRTPKTPSFARLVTFEVFELLGTYIDPEFDPDPGRDLMPKEPAVKSYVDGEGVRVIEIPVEDGSEELPYGLKITNGTSKPLYAWIFSFEMTSLAVSEVYRPRHAREGASYVDPCMTPLGGSLTIGYGSGGGVPIHFKLSSDFDADVSYMKVFISTLYIDMPRIELATPFPTDEDEDELSDPSVGRKISMVMSRRRDLWDAIIVRFVQKRKT